MKVCYVPHDFNTSSLVLIGQADSIIEEYVQQGYRLTLRQIYYQFVARGWLPNTMRMYKRVGSILNDARLAGLIDWEAIEDRTRRLIKQGTWEDPAELVAACAEQYAVDRWEGQDWRPEVWIEKEALIGVIEPVCKKLQVPHFACRGYVSQSSAWRAAARLNGYVDGGQKALIIYLGDHDPSGLDMTEDIANRMWIFGVSLEVRRIALTYAQVQEYNPPANPAKLSDSRARGYIAVFGSDSWELDALEPSVIGSLIESTVRGVRDEAAWAEAVAREYKERDELAAVAERWSDVQHFVMETRYEDEDHE